MKRRTGWIVFLAAVAVGGAWSAFSPSLHSLALAPGTPTLTFAVMDVGQGDSLYIESPSGERVVVDGGPDDSILTDLPTLMPPGDQYLNAIVMTHPDSDHYLGFIDLLKRYQVGEFIESGITKDDATHNELEAEVAQENIPRVIARRGMVVDLGGGAQLDVLYPDWDVTHMDVKQDNDGGIVARLVYGNTSALLMADVSTAVEDHLMQISSSSELKSDVLKVAHHGSKYSNDQAFDAEVSPSYAIISDGKNNTYGFPTPEVLSTLSSLNIPVLRTDQEGTVVCTSDGATFTCK